MAAGMDEQAAVNDLIECEHCGRSFREAALEKHMQICVKVFQKQRKPFNPTKQRMPAEAVEVISHSSKKGKGAGKKAAAAADDKQWQGKWKMKSEQFRQAMKMAKECTKCEKAGKPLPKAVPTAPDLDDRVQCPTCGRRFAEQAAERHIKFCQQQAMKKRGKPPPKR